VWLAVLVTATLCRQAKGQSSLRPIAARVAKQWREAGARVVVMPTRFVFDDETLVISLPANMHDACVHVALIATRGHGFHARLATSTDPFEREPAARATSHAGMAELYHCGGSLEQTRQVVLSSDAGRGAVEIVVATAPTRLGAAVDLVPERASGSVPGLVDAGPMPLLASVEVRASAAEERAKREGGLPAGRTSLWVNDDGMGEEALLLEEGCHRLEVFAKDDRRDLRSKRARVDVDAELRDSESGRVLARDRTDAPDARLETCIAQPTYARLVFAGAPRLDRAIMTQATWPIPDHVPRVWGPTVRGTFARALMTHQVTHLDDEPVIVVQGSPGTTPVALRAQAGACYVAIAAPTHGRPRKLELRADVGGRESFDERSAGEDSALVAFCANGNVTPTLHVTARGTGVRWALVVYRVVAGLWERAP